MKRTLKRTRAISRRAFLTEAARSAVGLTLGAGIVAACAPNETVSPTKLPAGTAEVGGGAATAYTTPVPSPTKEPTMRYLRDAESIPYPGIRALVRQRIAERQPPVLARGEAEGPIQPVARHVDGQPPKPALWPVKHIIGFGKGPGIIGHVSTDTITANDGGASGVTSPDGTTDMRQVTLFVNEVNDPPIVTVPASPASVLEDQVLDIRSLGDIEITDADAGNAVISVQLSVGHGTVTVNNLVPGAPTIVGNGTSQVSLSGTLVAINALLDSYVRYQGALNWNGTDVLTILANDLGNTGGPAASGVGRVTITVAPENDAPQISLPSDLSVNEDTDLRIPAIVLADPDVAEGGADGVITVTLSVSPIAPNLQTGTLTVNPAVVPALMVTGSPGSNLTVRGRLADINTMLAHPDGLKYRGALNGSGQVVFSVSSSPPRPDSVNSGA